MSDLYTRHQWQKASRAYLRRNPLCVYCLELKPPRTTQAYVVDHVIPHRGDMGLFWDINNWQPLCESCHNDIKKNEEITGVRKGHDPSGLPLDQSHHWYGEAKSSMKTMT